MYPTHHSLPHRKRIPIGGSAQVASVRPHTGRETGTCYQSGSKWTSDKTGSPKRFKQQIMETEVETFFVKRYTISTSQDGINWSNIQANGDDVVFDGNTNDDPDAIVTNELPVPRKTRCVRLTVVEWHGFNPGLRWGVVGCPV